ncbi:hypothetical protein Sango_2492900 [Sesamum angolense]|uniref:DUF4218 domain-containing protein n=1 Tax=Sesamum angolense TaxID=2727404 RepID=A0AAE2BI41_9LAMI|nr:hypothetical protein Sango_2492900 [Sesamum angolense]
MAYLIVQLSYKTHMGGPVYCRWMYPFERFLYDLKKKVKNKTHVQTSIIEPYIIKKIGQFTSHYFERHILCKQNKPSRNDDLRSNNDRIQRSIFNNPVQAYPE